MEINENGIIVERFSDEKLTDQELARREKLKKKKEREPYKRICNISYGATGDEFNAMYDPLNRNLVCVYGQVLMVMLLEELEEKVKSFKLIQLVKWLQ